MRPTTTNMLQQNNNNNYPCLNVSGSPREVLQKCSRGSLLFPSRLELGLGDLPLIRGLRAWALCSKNRKRAGLLGGGQAPIAPPTTPTTGRAAPNPCPRPADVYPTGELGQMGYRPGLPLGLDARQAGIGALVTVATLKASEGGGQTQTRCLFLRTEEGSCLYSTAQPGVCSLDMGPGMTPTGPSNLVGGWLRGKVGGGGGRDAPAGRRDNGPTPTAPTGANRVRTRSGRRWRKSHNAAGLGQERTRPNRERRARGERSGNLIVEERQEDRHNGGSPNNSLSSKHSPCSHQDSRSSKQEKGGTNGSPRCSHRAQSKTCIQCLGRGEGEGCERHEGPRGDGVVLNGLSDEVEGMKKGKQVKEEGEEEEERGGLTGLKSCVSSPVMSDSDPETNCCDPESYSNSGVGEKRQEANRETQETYSNSGVGEKREEDNRETQEIHSNSGVGEKREEDNRETLEIYSNSGVGEKKEEDNRETLEIYSNSDVGEKREEDYRERQEALQTQTAYGKDLNTEDEENVNTNAGERDVTSGVMKRQTGSCGGINNPTGQSTITSYSISRHNGDHDDKNTHSGETDTCSRAITKPTEISEGIVVGLNGFIEQMAADRELERESERLACLAGKTEKTNSWMPAQSSDMHCCSEEGRLSLLSSAPVPHSSSETPEPSTPVEGSTSTADNETTWEWEEQEKDTSDGEYNNNNTTTEEHLERDGLCKRNTGIVDEEGLDKRFEIHQSSSVAVDKEELCAEGKLFEVVDTVKETLIEPVSELGMHPENTQSTSEEARGPCEQPGETLCEVREEEEEEEGARQVEERNTTSPLLRQVEGHREVDPCVLETDRGIVRAAGEEDFARNEEVESRGTELNEQREDGRRDELNVGYREENEKLEQEKYNLVEGDRTAKEGNRTEAIWREGYSEALQDGGIKRDNVKDHNTDEKLDEWTDGYGKEESYRENNEEVKRDCVMKEDWRIQESAEEWRTEDTYVPPLTDPRPEETWGERWRGETGEACSSLSLSPTAAANAACAYPATSLPHALANPAPPHLPLGAMATDLPCLEVGVARAAEREGKGGSEGGGEGDRVVFLSPEEQGRERDQEQGSIVATEQERRRQGEEEEEEGEKEEEDEFGMFMQAEEESAWSEGFAVSASVPCGNRESAALGNHGIADESTYWTSSRTDRSFHHSEDTWKAFPQDSLDEGQDAVGQWWPINAVEERRDRLSTNQNLSTVLAEAFSSLPVPSCCDSDAIPTLTQLLREDPNCSRTSQDQGLLDNFHDLNKMIGQRYKRANGVSRDLLLQSLHLDHTYTDSRTGPWTANHHLSPGLPSSNQHVPTAAAKRRLSYDYNKNIME